MFEMFSLPFPRIAEISWNLSSLTFSEAQRINSRRRCNPGRKRREPIVETEFHGAPGYELGTGLKNFLENGLNTEAEE